jgi:excisionase family DNA binding protein
MVMMNDKNPLFTLTIGEFKNLVTELIQEVLSEKDEAAKKNKSASQDEVYFNIPELAAFLKCSKVSIHKYKKKGLPYRRIGRKILFKKSEVLAFMEKMTNKRIIYNY